MSRRLTSKRRRWLVRHSLLSFRRKVRRNAGRVARKEAKADIRKAEKSSGIQRKHGNVAYKPPSDFSLTREYEAVAQLLKSFRSGQIAKDRDKFRERKGLLDFTNIRYLSPAAALVLTAEVYRWNEISSYSIKPKKLNKWDPDVRRQLAESGFFELLGMDTYRPTTGSPDKRLQLVKFVSHDRHNGPKVETLLTALDAMSEANLVHDLPLNNAVAEAIINVPAHAYPDGWDWDVEILPKRWWLSGSFCSSPKEVRIMLFDQGVGIPQTLPTSSLGERVREHLTRLSLPVNQHCHMIRAAVAVGRSSVPQSGRGLGLQEICNYVDKRPGSYLRILSGRGEFIYRGHDKIECAEHEHDLGGTLVEWRIIWPSSDEVSTPKDAEP